MRPAPAAHLANAIAGRVSGELTAAPLVFLAPQRSGSAWARIGLSRSKNNSGPARQRATRTASVTYLGEAASGERSGQQQAIECCSLAVEPGFRQVVPLSQARHATRNAPAMAMLGSVPSRPLWASPRRTGFCQPLSPCLRQAQGPAAALVTAAVAGTPPSSSGAVRLGQNGTSRRMSATSAPSFQRREVLPAPSADGDPAIQACD